MYKEKNGKYSSPFTLAKALFPEIEDDKEVLKKIKELISWL